MGISSIVSKCRHGISKTACKACFGITLLVGPMAAGQYDLAVDVLDGLATTMQQRAASSATSSTSASETILQNTQRGELARAGPLQSDSPWIRVLLETLKSST
jgi:hypothetical protein